jgi:hypothetical protein
MQVYSVPMTPPADDDHGPGQALQAQQLVGAEDGVVVERHGGRACGAGAGGDDELVGGDDLGVGGALDVEGVVVLEVGRAPDQLDAVALEVAADDRQLGVDHLLADVDQVGDGDGLLDAGDLAEQPLPADAAQVEHGLAQGLAGDGAGVDAGATEDVFLLDDAGRLAELGGLDGRLLPGRTGPDHRKVEVSHARLGWVDEG